MLTQSKRQTWTATAACLIVGMVVSTGNAWADERLASASSPGKILDVSLQVSSDGRLAYQVSRRGKQLIAPSRLGFVLANGAPLDANFKIARQVVTRHDSTWEQPWGERRFVRNHYTEMRVDVRQKDAAGRRLAIVFRVFDDGVGFRYEFPQQAHMKAVHISDELTEFVVAQPATAWWQPAGEVWALEYPIQKSPLREVGMANTPLTIRTDDGTHIAFHEAALVDYASMWLRRVEGQKLRAHLTPSVSGAAVVRKGAFTTPWRTMQIADDAPGLYMSDLVLNLNEPNALGDVSWVKPSKFIGVWWEMHLNRSTWGGGAKHGATTAHTKRYIDFAAKHGIRGVLVEGWNLGWDENWPGSGASFSFTEPYPDFDLAGLAAYAAARNVRLVGHHETGGNIARYESQMDAAYKLYAKLGVDTIKSGYVTDAGAAQFAGPGRSVRFGYTDSQEGVRHFAKAVKEAAKYKLSIDTHEPVKDTGLRRTYPNWLTREGARGVEYNAWGNPVNQIGVYAHAQRADGLHARRAQFARRGRPLVQFDPGQAAGELRRDLFAGGDGGRPDRALRAVSGGVQIHQGCADRLVRHARALGRSGGAHRHRAQGQAIGGLVYRRRHRRQCPLAVPVARLPRSGQALSGRDLSRRRSGRLPQRAPVRPDHRKAGGVFDRYAGPAPGAGRRAGDQDHDQGLTLRWRETASQSGILAITLISKSKPYSHVTPTAVTVG